MNALGPFHPVIDNVASPTDDVAVARHVLGIEAQALTVLAASLDGAFTASVAVLAAVAGRIVVSGMGKSGHVARKIAATLASTGAPALFVHPAEASHGDLGMVVAGDAVVALSNSGETAELADLVAHTRRFALPLIAVTSAGDSTLARAADHVLLLPPEPEACPNGLAPTTSTTMQLALGDALAVALLTRRGFGPADFRAIHPGGKLGARLRRVRDVMHVGEALPLLAPETPMGAAILEMSRKRFGCVGAIADGQLVGILTDGDLRRAMGPNVLTRTIEQLMTRRPRTIGPDALAAEALQTMNARSIGALFVVDVEERPVGIVHVHDLLRDGIA